MSRSMRVAVACMGIITMSVLGAVAPASATSSSGSPPSAPPAAVDALTSESSPAPTASSAVAGKSSPKPRAKDSAQNDEAHPHDDDALLKASQALTEAETELKRAKTALASAREEVAAARTADAQAKAELEAAIFAHQRAVRDLVENRLRLEKHRSDLGQLARAAYRSNGPLGELALVLESQTPKQMADRMAFVQSIASAGNAVVSDLEEARADLENAKERLTAAREEQQERREAAAAALLAIETKERVAALAEQQVSTVVELRKLALAAALEAKRLDLERYQVMRVQSGRLGARITELGAALDASKKPPKGTGDFVLPGTGATTSPFGPRLHPILNYVKIHTGVDFGRGDGFTYAADDGIVIITDANVAYGNMTVIYHGKIGGLPTATLYAHQAAFAVEPGDRVRKGQAIGVIGSTGYSTGPHLHFEVLLAGKQVDPAPFLKAAPLPDAVR